MFGTNELMSEQAGFFNGKLKHLLGAFGKFDGGGFLQTHAGESFDHLAYAVGFKTQITQGVAGDTAILFY